MTKYDELTNQIEELLELLKKQKREIVIKDREISRLKKLLHEATKNVKYPDNIERR